MAYFSGAMWPMLVFSGRFQPAQPEASSPRSPRTRPPRRSKRPNEVERHGHKAGVNRVTWLKLRGENQSWIRSPFVFVWSFLALKYIWVISDTSSWVMTVHANYGKLQEDQKRFLCWCLVECCDGKACPLRDLCSCVFCLIAQLSNEKTLVDKAYMGD